MTDRGHRRAAAPRRLNPGVVVIKALHRAASRFGIPQVGVAAVIGVSPSKVTRMFKGGAGLNVAAKEGQLALLLLRVFRSLDSLVGGDEAAVQQWFHATNAHLGGVPAELVKTPQGLVHVADYLDAMRGTL